MTSEAIAPLEGVITDRAIEQLRQRIGIDVPGMRKGNTVVSRDAIVNYARGSGDLNPLFRDEEYAASTRWGGLVAHPSFIRYMGDCRPPSHFRDRPRSPGLNGDPLAGVHGFFSGVEVHCFRPLVPGDALRVRGGLADVQLKESRMGGQAVHEIYDKLWWDEQGALVGLARDLHIRIERARARTLKSKFDVEVPKHYTSEEIAEIDRAYDAAEHRGATPRFWEDVAVGDESAPSVRGPYTVTSFIVFMAGVGLLRNRFSFSHAEAHAERKRHPKAFPPNTLGIPDAANCVHWDKEMANRAGVPERYDAGAERIAWMSQAVTEWMGDDAFLQRFSVGIRGFFYVGDTLWITCRVADKFEQGEQRGVRLDLAGRNQRGEIVASGDADVLLPTRDRPVELPEPPTDVSIFQAAGPG